jgi:hypothetical protein
MRIDVAGAVAVLGAHPHLPCRDSSIQGAHWEEDQYTQVGWYLATKEMVLNMRCGTRGDDTIEQEGEEASACDRGMTATGLSRCGMRQVLCLCV